MKKRRLRPWIQDMLTISAFAKFGFLCMLVDFIVSPVTIAILAYVVISMMFEVHVLSKYELSNSLFYKVN